MPGIVSPNPETTSNPGDSAPNNYCDSRPCQGVDNTKCVSTNSGFVCECLEDHFPIHGNVTNGCKGKD